MAELRSTTWTSFPKRSYVPPGARCQSLQNQNIRQTTGTASQHSVHIHSAATSDYHDGHDIDESLSPAPSESTLIATPPHTELTGLFRPQTNMSETETLFSHHRCAEHGGRRDCRGWEGLAPAPAPPPQAVLRNSTERQTLEIHNSPYRLLRSSSYKQVPWIRCASIAIAAVGVLFTAGLIIAACFKHRPTSCGLFWCAAMCYIMSWVFFLFNFEGSWIDLAWKQF